HSNGQPCRHARPWQRGRVSPDSHRRYSDQSWDSSSWRRRASGAATGKRLLDLDLDGLRRRRLGLRQMHGQNSVLGIGADGSLVDVVRHRKAARERTAETFDAMEFLVAGFLLFLAFAVNGDHALVERHLDVFLADGG